jgi:hypothetical protein
MISRMMMPLRGTHPQVREFPSGCRLRPFTLYKYIRFKEPFENRERRSGTAAGFTGTFEIVVAGRPGGDHRKKETQFRAAQVSQPTAVEAYS